MQVILPAKCDYSMKSESRLQRVLSSSLVKGFVTYSIFRAIYGAGILLVTWLFATNTEYPWWVSAFFFVGSMAFSRILFKIINNTRSDSEIEESHP